MKQLFLKAIILATGILSLASCSDDKDQINKSDNKIVKNKYAMFIKTGKTDGVLVAYDKIPSGDIKVADILKKEGSYLQMADVGNPGFAFDGSIYNTYNLEGNPGIQKIKINSSGKFELGGFIPTQTDSRGGSDIFAIESNTKGYYSNAKLSKTALQKFNPETMERTGEIDFSIKIKEVIEDIKKDVKGEITTSIGKFMLVRDGKLFTQIFFKKDKLHAVDKSYIAVVDTKTDKLEKILIYDDFITFGNYKNSNFVGLTKDNDIYLGGLFGNFGSDDFFNFRVIRIKDGKTEIDNTWNINAKNDYGAPDFGLGGAGVLNGKLYLKMFSNKIDNDFSNLQNVKTYGAYEIDIVSKELKLIKDIPVGFWGHSSNHGPAIYEELPYFSVTEQSKADEEKEGHIESFYSYDPTTKKSKKVFTVIGGTPEHFIKL